MIKNTIPRIYSNKENSDIIKLFKELYKYADLITSDKEQIRKFQMKLLDNNNLYNFLEF
ncbi:hypothetical protein [Mycoplasmopsis bovirhinis]|uniref:hypothetical protein n=1 Tax=Mycoplasmopsis bovirhinis TaxID=29553 RepID=UPI0012FE2B2B|nr:hypothetical protein [Mycoplasmopsis bovirhinis]